MTERGDCTICGLPLDDTPYATAHGPAHIACGKIERAGLGAWADRGAFARTVATELQVLRREIAMHVGDAWRQLSASVVSLERWREAFTKLPPVPPAGERVEDRLASLEKDGKYLHARVTNLANLVTMPRPPAPGLEGTPPGRDALGQTRLGELIDVLGVLPGEDALQAAKRVMAALTSSTAGTMLQTAWDDREAAQVRVEELEAEVERQRVNLAVKTAGQREYDEAFARVQELERELRRRVAVAYRDAADLIQGSVAGSAPVAATLRKRAADVEWPSAR